MPHFEVPIQVCLLGHVESCITIQAKSVIVEEVVVLERKLRVKGGQHVQVVPDNIVNIHLGTCLHVKRQVCRSLGIYCQDGFHTDLWAANLMAPLVSVGTAIILDNIVAKVDVQ